MWTGCHRHLLPSRLSTCQACCSGMLYAITPAYHKAPNRHTSPWAVMDDPALATCFLCALLAASSAVAMACFGLLLCFWNGASRFVQQSVDSGEGPCSFKGRYAIIIWHVRACPMPTQSSHGSNGLISKHTIEHVFMGTACNQDYVPHHVHSRVLNDISAFHVIGRVAGWLLTRSNSTHWL